MLTGNYPREHARFTSLPLLGPHLEGLSLGFGRTATLVFPFISGSARHPSLMRGFVGVAFAASESSPGLSSSSSRRGLC